MDDPLVPKRLEDAITIVGTCPDMCPRFERYRREKEINLFQWEMIPGTKRVDHARAVKMYERASGDKIIPSDIRPPPVLKKTLDYLFRKLLPENGFIPTYDFVRDRSRAVRNDFTLQHESGALAMECTDRCARYHILALHYGRHINGFSVNMEEQQLMQCLQSLKEFYEDQRGRYESPNELEMRVYHRLIHIRDQRERPDSVPEHITSHPVFKLTTDFRLHVQKKSEPIRKNSPLVVGPEGMQIFAQLVDVLKQEGNLVMIFLVACILERLFGFDTIEDIEAIRQGMRDEDIIDGISHAPEASIEEVEVEGEEEEESFQEEAENDGDDEEEMEDDEEPLESSVPPTTTAPSAPVTFPQVSPFGQKNAFANLTPTPSPFGSNSPFGKPSVFGGSVFGKPSATPPTTSVFGNPSTAPSSTPPVVAPSPPVAVPSPPTQTASAQPVSSIFGSNLIPQPPKIEGAPKEPPTLNPAAPIFQPRPQLAPSIFSKPLVAPEPPIIAPAVPPPSQPVTRVEPTPPPHIAAPLIQPLPTSSSAPTLSAPAPSLLHRRTSSSSTQDLPKIITNISSTAPSFFTPLGKTPPPAPKPLPISLPPTPGISGLSALKGPSFTDLLSPLTFTPTVSRANSLKSFPLPPQPSASPKKPNANKEAPPFDKVLIVAKAPEIQPPPPPPPPSKEEQEQAAYAKAVQKSDEYSRKQKERRDHVVESISAPPRLSQVPLRKKQPRTRLSKEYKPPLTDEELAKRLQNNREEHEQRWAQGTFLQATRQLFQSHSALHKDETRTTLWLSLNPENDGTAIWVERKFDVPSNPGEWFSDTIYSIPVKAGSSSKTKASVESPIMIVFECTPLEGIDDDIERKFRVLEDCARLRQVIKSLPEKRWRVPSLFVFRWASETAPDSHSDMTQMMGSLVKDGTLESYKIFNVGSESKDLDVKFVQMLSGTKFDVVGRLICAVTPQNIYSHFEHPWKDIARRWLDKCTRRGEFDHAFYAKLIHALLTVLEQLDIVTASLLKGKPTKWPPFNPDSVEDADSLYDCTTAWLTTSPLSTSDEITTDLQTHRMMERDFPSETFISQLWHAVQPQGGSAVHLMKSELEAAVAGFKQLLDAKEPVLQQMYSIAARRSPKRRRESSVTTNTDCDMSVVSTPGSKRRRLSSSLDGPTASPTPSPAPLNGVRTDDESPEEPPQKKSSVSISMLRALTKEIKGKYGRVS